MNKPKLEHIEKAIEYMGAPVGCNPTVWFIGVNTRINAIALAEQQALAAPEVSAKQESEFITAEQARELGAGNAEWRWSDGTWESVGDVFPYFTDAQYRAIKQAQPEPSIKRADLCIEYLRQRNNVPCELGFYLWEYKNPSYDSWRECIVAPRFVAEHGYRCTDISCYVSKDGEPAIRMLIEDAIKVLSDTKNTALSIVRSKSC
jgi:hypothetical protein